MKTTPFTQQRGPGYVINSGLSKENISIIEKFQEALLQQFPSGIWCPPLESIHITLMDWLAPLVDYGKSKDKIFEEVFNEYDTVFCEITSKIKSFSVIFNSLHVTPNAIFAVGQDNGEYALLRNSFLSKVRLIEGTKQPPKIIHFTIARFTAALELKAITDFVSSYPINILENVEKFRLVKELQTPMVDFEIIKEYTLPPHS